MFSPTSSTTPQHGSRSGDALRFVFIAPVVDEAFYGPVKLGMSDAARAMSVESTFIGTAGVDVEAQAQLITNALVGQEIDGIAVNLIHPTGFDVAVRRAVDAGIPVIAFNTDSGPQCGRLSAVAQDCSTAGRLLGQNVSEVADRQKKVLITMHDAGVMGLERRVASVIEVLSSKGIAHCLAIAHSTAEGSAEIIYRRLTLDPSIGFVCGSGLADTEGAGLAMERLGRGTYCQVAGFDVSDEVLRLIRQGVICCTIDQQPYLQGFYPVVQLAHFCRYGLQPFDIDTGHVLITASSLDRPAATSGAKPLKEPSESS
jgi:simple sugar transport system substrate-binding protein